MPTAIFILFRRLILWFQKLVVLGVSVLIPLAGSEASSLITSLPNGTSLSWSGDLRLRGQVENESAADNRQSGKMRVRLGVKAQAEEHLKAEIRLATATSARSTNQTLADNSEPGFARRSIGLDLAYADWNPSPLFRFQAGRIPQFHFRPGGSQVLLDDDISLEGYSVQSRLELNEKSSLNLAAGSALARENFESKVYMMDETDNFIHSADVFYQFKNPDHELSAGLGFMNFVAVQGRNFSDFATGGTALGNSESTTGIVKDNYRPLHFYLDHQMQFDKHRMGWFFEHTVNDDTRDANKAWWVGLQWKRNPWSLHLAYAAVQSDAVLALFTNSDFAGGQTDCRGWVGQMQYDFNKNMALKWTQFANRQKVSSQDLQYNRTHLDLTAKF